MSTTYTGDRTATQAPSSAPDKSVSPQGVIPADGEALNVASITQAFKVCLDFLDKITHDTGFLDKTNTWTLAQTIQNGIVVTRSTADTTAVDATGNGTGSGVAAQGGATGNGITAAGGATSGAGGSLTGGPDSPGVIGGGTGTGAGGSFTGGATGKGVVATGQGGALGLDVTAGGASVTGAIDGSTTVTGGTGLAVNTKYAVDTNGVTTKYNNESTTAVGQPYIVKSGIDVASSGAGAQTTDVADFTPAASGVYRLTAVVSVTTGDTVTVEGTYTDAVNTTATAAPIMTTVTIGGNDTYSYSILIRANTSTHIKIRLTLSSHNTTKVSGVIERLI